MLQESSSDNCFHLLGASRLQHGAAPLTRSAGMGVEIASLQTPTPTDPKRPPHSMRNMGPWEGNQGNHRLRQISILLPEQRKTFSQVHA